MSRVVVAMSGGVDSAVAAAILRDEGHEVIGITLRLYDCEDGTSERSCCGLSGVMEARLSANALGLPHYVIDGQELFERRVLRYAWDTYVDGRTPNPCVVCNEWLKFGLLYDRAKQLGAEWVATGHHARVRHDADGRSRLLRGLDESKDQSYFLYSLTAEQLRMSLLPIGDLTKQEVRAKAAQLALPNANRLESQDACIAQRGDLAEALRQRFSGERRPGNLRDTSGKVLGRHEGIHHFTIGQRKGLGIALGFRGYVVAIDAVTGDVVIGEDRDLAATGLIANKMTWLDRGFPREPMRVEAKIRYRHRAVAALLEYDGTAATLRFDEAQRAVTPGQALVLYRGDEVLGGGWIDRALVEPHTASQSLADVAPPVV